MLDEHYFFIMKNGFENLNDYIDPYNIKYQYSPQTYWEPEDERLDYDIDEDGIKELYNHLTIIEYIYNSSAVNPYIIKFQNFEFKVNTEDEVEKIFKAVDLHYITDYISLDNYFDSQKQALAAIENYINELAEKKAREYLENREYYD